jgi:protein-tyrosine-phosphatase
VRPFEKKKDRVIILFLDTGDNCRCPMAKGYLTKLLDQHKITYVEIRTAGVMTPSDLKPQAEAVLLLQEEGVDVTRHRSRPVTEKLLKEADLILGMTPFHVQTAHRKCEDARGKTFLLKEYVGAQGRNTQIADPMGGTLEIFKKCFGELRLALQKLAEMEIIQKPDIDIPPPPPPPPPDETAAPEPERKKAAAKMPAAKKVRKPAAAKPAPKPTPKPQPKAKAGTKPAPRGKAASVKVAAKKPKAKPAKKVVAKPKAKKPPPKKAAAKKPAAKKPAAKKPAAKKPAAKKPAGKKPAVKKPAAKKASSTKKGKK